MPPSNQIPTFNLKAVVRETGLKPDTLRAWERRYGLPRPQRTSGGHRLYSQHDIDMLKWLAARQEEGLSISRAIDLWHSLQEEGQDPLQAPSALAPAATLQPALPTGSAISELRQGWISACLAFDERTAENILAQASALYPLEMVSLEILQKGLVQLGEAWYNGEVTVQQEHFASALAMRRLAALISATPAPTRSSRILVGCPPDEEHAFGPLLINLLLRRHGWDVLYLGANIPVHRLKITVVITKPQLTILPAQQLHTTATLLDMAQLLQEERAPLAFGGKIFNDLPALRSRIPGHFLGERLDLIPQAVEQLLLSSRPGWPPPAISEPSGLYQQVLNYYRERQSLIESYIWEQMMKMEHITHDWLAEINAKFARDIIAALRLGDIHFTNPSIAWLEDLFTTQEMPAEQFQRYLQVYYQAVKTHLNQRGRIISDWLAEVVKENGKVS